MSLDCDLPIAAMGREAKELYKGNNLTEQARDD